MSAAEDRDRLRHWLDALSPEQARRALVLLSSDPDLAAAERRDLETVPAIQRPGFAAFVGMGRSGHADTARRHRDVIQEWSDDGR
jgi:hypothetical protein